MKRFLKVCICLLMVVGVVGCGGSDSTEKQEAVVKHFFEYFKEADMDKLTTICTKDNQDLKDITSMISGLDAYRDPKKFGQVFVDETDSFMKEVKEKYYDKMKETNQLYLFKTYTSYKCRKK